VDSNSRYRCLNWQTTAFRAAFATMQRFLVAAPQSTRKAASGEVCLIPRAEAFRSGELAQLKSVGFAVSDRIGGAVSNTAVPRSRLIPDGFTPSREAAAARWRSGSASGVIAVLRTGSPRCRRVLFVEPIDLVAEFVEDCLGLCAAYHRHVPSPPEAPILQCVENSYIVLSIVTHR
jgi:hypothetical protein